MSKLSRLRVVGACQNNLKNLTFDLPLNQLIVVTGLSGSGKSSLAFDTLYAEGQRRYVETFSPYTRQFLERMDKPKVERIEGIPPAIAISQANAVRSSRSTVGTMTEINDYLKHLFPLMAELHSPDTGKVIRPWTATEIVREVLNRFEGRTIWVNFRVPFPEGTSWEQAGSFLTAQGMVRIAWKGKAIRLDQAQPPDFCDASQPFMLEVIYDRMVVSSRNKGRLQEAVSAALRLGKNVMHLVDEADGAGVEFSSAWVDPESGREFSPPSPAGFSFNNPVAACPVCRGFGRTVEIDYDLVIPDRSLSIRDGAIKPFQSGVSAECQADLLRACRRAGVPVEVPFAELSPEQQQWVIEGERQGQESSHELWEAGRWYGVKGYFEWLESKTYKMHVRVLLSRYRSYRTCPVCQGTRFRPEVSWWKLRHPTLGPRSLQELQAMPLREALKFFEGLEAPDKSAAVLLQQVVSRLRFLDEVGLGYLNLNRATRTLSGGEVQRVNLTTCLGTSLVGTLFVLDEPSIGLHPRDTERLIRVLRHLRDQGNTVLVVEHDESVIRAADTILELGPGRGEKGGELVYLGSMAGLLKQAGSITARHLTGQAPPPEVRQRPIDPQGPWLRVRGARKHNLRDVEVDLPLKRFTVITGVSGSGKSTLVHEIIFKQLRLAKGEPVDEPGQVESFTGADLVSETILVDQAPLSQNPRSTPLLYLGVYDAVRGLFASTEAARRVGLSASAFSFNSGDGRCERCNGMGYEKISMQFLSDVFVLCPVCQGRRFKKHVLEVRWRGWNIADFFDLTVGAAIESLAQADETESPREARWRDKILKALRLLDEVGLGYLRLGQSLNQLSGGEAQRLKLIAWFTEAMSDELSASSPRSRSKPRNHHRPTRVFILDEPTTGLHMADVRVLLQLLQKMVDQGDTLIVIEHNLDVIRAVDWVIDLGPEAGDEGGRVVAAGRPADLPSFPESRTGQFLRESVAASAAKPASSNQSHLALQAPPPDDRICIRGARHHNLKNIDVDIPRDQLVVLTGLSGSGKSSLAFDLLFAEGQRRYLDCLNTYARQFIEQLERPEVDAITGIPPTVAIEQRTTRGGRKSTVATVTEIYHFLRLLYAKLGHPHDPETGEPAIRQSTDEIIQRLTRAARRKTLTLLAPLIRARKGLHSEVATWAVRHGYTHLRVDGRILEAENFQALDRYREHTIELVLGPIRARDADLPSRVSAALEFGRGVCLTLDSEGQLAVWSTAFFCPGSGRSFDELDPRLFSFNSPHGWCETCQGFGTLPARAVSPRARSAAEREQEFERLREDQEEGEAIRCPDCQGTRLNRIARAVRLAGRSVAEINQMTAVEMLDFFSGLKFEGRDAVIVRDILPEITQRLHFLRQVGLDYLRLDRAAPTLSGGESQRIRLAAQLGSNLQGVLYVLDEPTIGLHPRDTQQLNHTLRELQSRGNSVVVVEHDESTMRAADLILDLGPGAGVHGGQIVARGSWKELSRKKKSVTGLLLGEAMKHPSRGVRRDLRTAPSWIEIFGACAHNLKKITVRIPHERLIVLSGVSGAGKSTFLHEVLLPAVRMARAPGRKQSVPWTQVRGAEVFDRVVEVDQAPIGKTSRSTVATYTGMMDHLRRLFAAQTEARIRGFHAGHFSFNSGSGRCPACEGQGMIKVQMNFLPDTYVPCEVCNGRRWKDEVLAVTYRGRNIHEVLQLSVDEAVEFFEAQNRLLTPLQLLRQVGLGYLTLGQASPTLSGGEAQRIKLVGELAAAQAAQKHKTNRLGASPVSPTLYLLEEPTVGLHPADVRRLIELLHQLVDSGHTVVVVEHNLDVIAEADYVIDIGPEAGERGGELVAAGSPEQVAKSRLSRTAPFLRQALGL